MKTTTRCLVMLCLSVCLRAQQFDAVSIKPNPSGETNRSFRANPNGQIVGTNVTVRHMMWNAYNLQDWEIVGGPEWLSQDRFDLIAKSDRGGLRPDDLRQMLRVMLADRFQLRARLVTQEMPIYALVIARNDKRLGASLTSVPGPCDPAQPTRQCGFGVSGGSLQGQNVTIPRLAQELTGIVERRVIDRTGLAGLYSLELKWSPDQQGDVPSLFTAIQEQLGLKLEPQRAPVDVLLIDGVEHPSEN